MIRLSRPRDLKISDIVSKLEKHYSVGGTGSSRLPVLAVYSVMKLVVKEVGRYKDCKIMELEEHNSPDEKSGAIGDLEIQKEDGSAYEGFEIKHEIEISEGIIETAYEKFRGMKIDRYYILTTHPSGSKRSLERQINNVKKSDGCQLIVNGVNPTIKYYLRLLKDTSRFIDEYVDLVEKDNSMTYELKKAWNDLCLED